MTVTTDNGIKATFASADVGVEDGSLSTSDPVAIELEGSSITADSFSVRERGAVLVFENRVRMKIDPASVRFVTRAQLEGAELASFRQALATFKAITPGPR